MRHLGFVAGSTLALLVLLFSVSSAAQGGDRDAAELRNYTLSMAALQKYAAASKALDSAMKADPRQQKISALQKELDALEEKEEPTDADLDRIEALREQIEAAEDSGGCPDEPEGQSLADIEATIRKQPAAARAIQGAGLTPREYATIMLAYTQAALVYGMQKSGLMKGTSKELEATVNPENVKFIAANEAELEKLLGK